MFKHAKKYLSFWKSLIVIQIKSLVLEKLFILNDYLFWLEVEFYWLGLNKSSKAKLEMAEGASLIRTQIGLCWLQSHVSQFWATLFSFLLTWWKEMYVSKAGWEGHTIFLHQTKIGGKMISLFFFFDNWKRSALPKRKQQNKR